MDHDIFNYWYEVIYDFRLYVQSYTEIYCIICQYSSFLEGLICRRVIDHSKELNRDGHYFHDVCFCEFLFS